MIRKQKTTGRAASMTAGLAFGGSVSAAVTLIATAALAKLVAAEKIAWENIGYGVMIMLLTSAFSGSTAAMQKIKRQKLLVSCAAGGVYYALLLSITALFFGGQYEGVLVTAILVFGGSLVAGLLGLRGDSGGRRKKIRLSHR